MIELNADQRQELKGPEPAHARDPETKQEYILVRREVYDRLRAVLEDDDTVFTTAEVLDRVMAEDDENDPHLEALQLQYGAKKP